MAIIGSDTMFTGDFLLEMKIEPEDTLLINLCETFDLVWNDPKRPDIKPGRCYLLTVTFQELPEDSHESE